MGERKEATGPHPRRRATRGAPSPQTARSRRVELAAALEQSGGKRSTRTRRAGASGQRRRWATVVHHGTNGHGLRKVPACTDRMGGQTDPPDPPVWASGSKED